jgi:hypothetical protein
LALTERLGMHGNAVAKNRFAALPAGDQAMPTTIDDRISSWGNTPAPRRSRAAKRCRVRECVHHP